MDLQKTTGPLEDLVRYPLEYRGERVVTFAQVDRVHDKARSSENFRTNRRQFVEGEDFFDVPYEEWCEILTARHPCSQDGSPGGYRGSMVFLTEFGYALLCKTFKDDLSWELYRRVLKDYFGRRSEPLAPGWLQPYVEATLELARGLKVGHEEVCSKIDHVGEKVESVDRRVTSLEETVSGLSNPRRQPTEKSRSLHRRALKNTKRRTCPCCSVTEIADGSYTLIRGAHEWDHWYARNRCEARDIWPVCRDCNRKLRDPIFHHERAPKFQAWITDMMQHGGRDASQLEFSWPR